MREAPIPEKTLVAGQLAVWDLAAQRESPEHAKRVAALQTYLAYQPWRSTQETADYEDHLMASGLEHFVLTLQHGDSLEENLHVEELSEGFTTPRIRNAIMEAFIKKRSEGRD